MNTSTIHIRPAQMSELSTIKSILNEGAERMKELGASLWETEQLEPSHLEAVAKKGQLFTVLLNGEIVGTFKMQTEDSVFWPEMNTNDAVYLHKIAITKRMRGKGLTREIIDWAKSYAAKKGRRFLRLDTDRTRPGLCKLYRDLGFSDHSYKKLDWIEVVRFEMPIR